MSSKSIYFASFLLISLMPILLVTGPFLADLSVVILNFFFFYIVFKNKQFELFKNKFFILFIFFCTLLIIRSLFTINLDISLKSVLFYFRFLVFSLMVYLTLKNYPNFIKHFSIIFLITINFILFDSIIQYLFGKDIFGITSGHPVRVSGPFGDELVLGSFLSRFAPFLLFFFYNTKKPLNFLFIITFLLGFFVTILSAERTSTIYYIISILFFLLYSKKIYKTKIFVIVALISSVIFFNNFGEQKKRLFTEAFKNSQDAKVWISTMHDAHLRTAINMFLQNPIFGVGPKMFRYHCSEKRYEIKNPPNPRSNELRCSTHPHNLLVQIMAETGLLGMLLYLITLLFVIIQLIKELILRFKKNDEQIVNPKIFFLLSFFLTLFPLAPSGNIFNNWISIIFFYPLGFYLYFSKND